MTELTTKAARDFIGEYIRNGKVEYSYVEVPTETIRDLLLEVEAEARDGVTLTREPGLDGTTEAAIRAERARIRAGITEAMLVENQNRGAVKERQRILRWLDGEPSTAERIRAATPFPHGCAYCGNVHLAPEDRT